MKHVGSHAAFWAAIATGVLLGAGGAAAAPPPPPTITSHPPDPSHVDTATFGFSDDDPTATFECRLDSADPAAFQPCPNPATTPPPRRRGPCLRCSGGQRGWARRARANSAIYMDDRHNAPAATFDHRETGEPFQ